MAAPIKDIDFELVDKLCSIFCTGEEIAATVGVSYPTLLARIKEIQKPDGTYYNGYLDYFEVKSASGKISLRRKQMQVAVSGGNVQMLKWMGANTLGQSDKQTVENIGETKIYIDVVDDDGGD